jgi:hypothetical protein
MRSTISSVQQPRIIPMPDEDDDEDRAMDSDDSDRKSKMSFSYWGADKVTLQKPVIKPKSPAPGQSSAGQRRSGPSPASYGRESSANAKFGTRLVAEAPGPSARAPSRRTQATPTSRRPTQSEDGHGVVRATVTRERPAWGAGAAPRPGTATPQPTATSTTTKRPRNTSQQSSTAVRATVTAKAPMASPAPSEDSGVGLYRQMMAKDPSLKDL